MTFYRRAFTIVAWVTAVVCGAVLVAGAARGQTTQPATPPQATLLRDIAADYERLDAEQRETYRLRLEAELECEVLKKANARLTAALAAAAPEWKPGAKLTPGSFWKLPDGAGVNIVVEVPNVTFFGGWVWPENGPAFDQRPGGDYLTVVGARIHHPNPPTEANGKRDVPAVLFSRARRPTLLNCEIGTVGEIAKLWPGGDRALVAGCTAGPDVYSAAVGCWGADEAVVVFNDFADSVTENLVRFSPQGDAVPDGAVVAFNALANPSRGGKGPKAAIDFRHVTNFVAVGNDLRSNDHGAGIGVGRGDGPGATNGYLIANRLHGARIHVYQARGLSIEDNRLLWETQGVNSAIYLGAAEDVRVRRNRGPEPAPGSEWNAKRNRWEAIPPKAIVGYSPAAGVRDDDGSSGWDAPAPGTQPATQPPAKAQ